MIKFVKIKVVKSDGNDCDVPSLLLRYLFRFLIYEESLLIIPWAYTSFNMSINMSVVER